MSKAKDASRPRDPGTAGLGAAWENSWGERPQEGRNWKAQIRVKTRERQQEGAVRGQQLRGSPSVAAGPHGRAPG